MKKAIVMMIPSFLSAILLAGGIADMRISFHTEGPDRYSDGTTVMDGESYVLVWSRDGNFDGFTVCGSCVDAQDKIVLVAPVAKNGRCPSVLFQVPAAEAEALAGGKYAVYLLDTRVIDRGTLTPDNGNINAYGSATQSLPSQGPASGEIVKETVNTPKGQVASIPAVGGEQLFIKAIRVEDDKVVLRVENKEGYMRVKYGSSLSSPDKSTTAVKTYGGSEDVVLEAGKDGEKCFYRVIHTGK